MTSRHVWRIVALAIVLGVAASVVFGGRMQTKMRDFEVYWTAGARASLAEPLYREADGHYRFKYLPGFAVAIAPIARLPLATAKAVWLGFSIACLVAFVALAVALVPRPAWGRGAVAALTVVAMAKFFGHELVLGQGNLLFGLMCAIGLAALTGRREIVAGLSFGLATLVKPYAIGFVVYLMLIRRWRVAAAALAGAGLAVLLPLPVYGLPGTGALLVDWWRTASETSAPLLTNADATSVFAMYAKWIGWGSAAFALSAITLAVLAAAFALVVLKRAALANPEVLEGALLLTLIPLATPQGWDYALLLSAPLVALVIDRARSMPRPDRVVTVVALALVAFSLYDVMGRAAYRAFMASSLITVCYLGLIAIAVRLRLRREA